MIATCNNEGCANNPETDPAKGLDEAPPCLHCICPHDEGRNAGNRCPKCGKSLDTRPRGFAALTREQRQEIARAGGRAVQANGTGHRWTSKTAKDAGRRGGPAAAAKRRETAQRRQEEKTS